MKNSRRFVNIVGILLGLITFLIILSALFYFLRLQPSRWGMRPRFHHWWRWEEGV